jgi:phosphatidylserine decarboxylase
MTFRIAKGGWSHIAIPVVLFGFLGYGAQAGLHQPILAGCLYAAGAVVAGFMVYFFRDPERPNTVGPQEILAGADGWVRRVETVSEPNFLKTETVRICTFLTPFDVHVNRAPIGGEVKALAYTPGRHFLTIRQAASEYNEHSSILIEGHGTRCLVKQIVGPIVRRVVYWLQEGQELSKGDRIGIMKFGSRMDVYFPATDVEVLVKKGDRVFAGKTILARLKKS